MNQKPKGVEMKNANRVRFAPLIRVSTDKQADRGESLKTQKKQILHTVETLGGTIPDNCWIYSGQEHATAGYERQLMDRLLADSSRGMFDAVIVTENTRWSRNNRKSDEGLDILQENGIRFFIGMREIDLEDYDERDMLTVQTVFAGNIMKKMIKSSVQNRISRAMKGIPSVGNKPYGRVFKDDKWIIDSQKQLIIERIADRYIKGEKGIANLAVENKMNPAYLRTVLMERCGDGWSVTFKTTARIINELGLKSHACDNDAPIHRVTVSENPDPEERLKKYTIEIVLKIPPLLPPEKIARIKERARKNLSSTHGPRRGVEHLLSGMIKCGHCGASLTGQSSGNRTRKRYEHMNNPNLRPCPHFGRWAVRADMIDDAVMFHVFSLFGNRSALEKALNKASPDSEKAENIQKLIDSYRNEIKDIKAKIEKVIDAIEDGTLSREVIRERMARYKARDQFLNDEIEKLSAQIANVPTRRELGAFAKRILAKANEQYFKSYEAFKAMTFKERRELLASLLSGKDIEGKPYGVFIFNEGGTKRSYMIKGVLNTEIIDNLPMHEGQKEDLVEGYKAVTGKDNTTACSIPRSHHA